MNRLMMRWPLMAEEGNPGGGGNQPTANDPPKEDPPKSDPPTANDPPKNDPPPAGDPPKEDPPKSDPPPAKPVNLMGDDEAEPEKNKQGEEAKPPTDEEQKAYRESIKAINLGEGVKFDDAALEAMTPALMKLSGNDPKKSEEIVKAYTDFQRKQVAAAQEQQDQFLNGLVAECQKRFGDDLKQICALAKAGGRHVFGDELWNVMKQERAFANNPDIIERLAAIGRTVKDDHGVTATKTKTAGGDRDWRESMYGGKK